MAVESRAGTAGGRTFCWIAGAAALAVVLSLAVVFWPKGSPPPLPAADGGAAYRYRDELKPLQAQQGVARQWARALAKLGHDGLLHGDSLATGENHYRVAKADYDRWLDRVQSALDAGGPADHDAGLRGDLVTALRSGERFIRFAQDAHAAATGHRAVPGTLPSPDDLAENAMAAVARLRDRVQEVGPDEMKQALDGCRWPDLARIEGE